MATWPLPVFARTGREGGRKAMAESNSTDIPTSRAALGGNAQQHRESSDGAVDSVAQLVTQQATIRPNAPAVSSSAACLSYGELEARSNEVAQALRSMGVGPETAIALHLPRSPAMVVGALG